MSTTVAAPVEGRSLLRFATAGSVDDGKSTLIGRLLYDAKALLVDQIEHIEAMGAARGGDGPDLALVTDGLRAEREQGITIDVAYRYFATPRRRFIIADTPGHEQYTRNMVTGASTADLAIVLIDARKGVIEQSRRHAFIAALLGVPHLVVCVNKMDLVDYDEGVFERIESDFRAFAGRLELPDLTCIPISALIGDNVVEHSANMPWYEGPSLLYHLEHVHVAADRNLIDMRFPVQWVIRDSDYRGYAGQIASGLLRRGEEIVVLPSGERSRIARIDTLDGPLEEAFAPMSVTVVLEDELDVSRGDMICRPRNRPRLGRDLEATVCWMNPEPARAGGRYVIKQTSRETPAQITAVRYRIDVQTLHRDTSAGRLELNDIGRIAVRTRDPIAFDPYRENRATGAFILIDEATNETVGAAMALGAGVVAPEAAPAGTEVYWHGAEIGREDRWRALGHRGATVWLTGLPSSGKSTVARRLEERLVRSGHAAYVLDGDNLRHGINRDLGFDHESRRENVRRVGEVARLLADAGTIALVSLVSPYTADRDAVREAHEADDLPFIEVHVDTPLSECERRDPKGLYARARAGEIPDFTGIGAPYEPPSSPEVRIDGTEDDTALAALLHERLAAEGIVPAP